MCGQKAHFALGEALPRKTAHLHAPDFEKHGHTRVGVKTGLE